MNASSPDSAELDDEAGDEGDDDGDDDPLTRGRHHAERRRRPVHRGGGGGGRIRMRGIVHGCSWIRSGE